MTTTTKFCTLDAVKAYMRDAIGYNGDDALITEHIITATATIREYTRRNWERTQRTQLFDSKDINQSLNVGQGMASFTLKEKPLVSIDTVVFHAGGAFADARALDAANYTVDLDRNRVVIYPGIMTSGRGQLQVTYTAGYEPDATDPLLLKVGTNIARACAIQAAFTTRQVLNETSGKKQKQDKLGFANFGLTSSGLVADALALVKSETRILVGGNG